MKEYILKITDEYSGERLDLAITRFLTGYDLGVSRVRAQKIIRQGHVTPGGITLKPHYKVKPGEEFRIILEDKETNNFEPENILLDIVYQDKDVAVINKPCGLVVHQAPGNYSHTLVNALLYHFKELSDINPQRPGIVHRLDKDTSGLILVAKNNAAHLVLAKQFAVHSVDRKYIAIVKGAVEFDEHIIEMPIGRHQYKRKMMAVRFGEGARFAKTHYRTLKRTPDYSVLELTPFTGRTHQLRVHLAFCGHPIMGDTKYGRDNGFGRLALHSFYVGFKHPISGRSMGFFSSVPVEFKEYMKNVKVIKKP